jgi:hypothetical protein
MRILKKIRSNTFLFALFLISSQSCFSYTDEVKIFLSYLESQVSKVEVAKFEVQQKPEYIVYGSKSFGFFKTSNFTLNDGELVIDIIPPFYGEAVTFYTSVNDEEKKLGGKVYTSPYLSLEKFLKIKKTGVFNYYFFAMTIPVQIDGINLSVPIILNKRGQIVWAYLNHEGMAGGSNIKKVSSDEYIILFSKNELIWVNFKDRKTIRYPVKKTKGLSRINHEFHLDNHELSFINHEYSFNIIDFFKYPFAFLRRRSVVGRFEKIKKLNLRSKRVETLVDLREYYSLKRNYTFYLEKVLRKRTDPTGFRTRFKKVLNGKEYSSHEFFHTNSISRKGDWLAVSVPLKCQLLLVNSKTNESFRVGYEGDIEPEEELDRFCFQHDVNIIDENTISLIDNFSALINPSFGKKTRALVIKLDKEKRTYKRVWDFEASNFSTRHGTIEYGKNIFLYFSHLSHLKKYENGFWQILEVNEDKSIRAQMLFDLYNKEKLDLSLLNTSLQIQPLFSIHDKLYEKSL